MVRRGADRPDARAPHPDQPSDRGDAQGHTLVPAFGSRHRSPGQSRRPVREGGWRGGRGAMIADMASLAFASTQNFSVVRNPKTEALRNALPGSGLAGAVAPPPGWTMY